MIQEQILEIDIQAMRERILPLPTSAQGYTRTLLVGMTGSGKTTLVRQLLGIRPTEHFPPIASSKTTTAEFEAILQEGPFKAIVTFISKQDVKTYVEECILATAQMYLEGKEDGSAARKFLEHEEQRFRLSYILGEFPLRRKRADHLNNNLMQDELTIEEAQNFANIIKQYLDTIRLLVHTCRENVELETHSLRKGASNVDYDIQFQEQLEQEIHQQATFRSLIDDIITSIQQRFDALTEGAVIRDQQNWPLYWVFQTTDRKEFLKTVSPFSSNRASLFGKLLTPLVQTIRIAGPFCPEWTQEAIPRLVLIDGEGLGHTPATAAALSTRTTSLFEEVDVILLVDNAKQPIQAASQAVMETVTTSGFASKLLICFTHFEGVDGDPFSDRDAREDHIRNSLDNVITGIGKKIGMRDKYMLRRSLEDRMFFLAHLQHRLTPNTQATSDEPELPETREELRKMLVTLEATLVPPISKEIRPIYDEHSLFSYIQKAVKKFREKWQGLLGLAAVQGVLPEHWTRIKALTRRPAFLGKDEYDTLKPAADLIRELSEQLKRFLEKPLRWDPPHQGTEEERQIIIDTIARELYPQFHKIVREQLIIDPRPTWQIAFARQGKGSATVRAHDVDNLYRAIAPTFSEIVQELDMQQTYPPLSATFANKIQQDTSDRRDKLTLQIMELVRQALQASGGKIMTA